MTTSFGILPVILAGGQGSRLWPMSRALFPKQFLSLGSPRSMLQETIARICDFPQSSSPLVICNEEHRFIVAEQLRAERIEGAEILLEPVGRNTAPAIALAALHATRSGDDPYLLVLAADHTIEDKAAFHAALAEAVTAASAGALVTFGVPPRVPEIGYGYIKVLAPIDGNARPVAEFVEKPDHETALGYLKSGLYYWNSGMFLFKASSYLQELGKFSPTILHACQNSLEVAQKDLDFIRLDVERFAICPEDSIDYAIMEKTDRAVMVSLDAGWNDIGSWSALWDVGEKDEHGNVSIGDIFSVDSANCYFNSSDGRLVAAVGVDGLAIVATADAVLVADKGKVQQVKSIVDHLKAAGRKEALQHCTVYRPWGSYSGVDLGDRYQVKRIMVQPGAKLSLQMHHHRAEHWIIVSGTAKVRQGNNEMLLTENQSVYIPLGCLHSLENPGKIPLELIEVQTGSYLGEDDIVRMHDIYGRS